VAREDKAPAVPARSADGMSSTPSPAPSLPRAWWPRLHLAELCDQPWLPATIRDAETAYLAAAVGLARPFATLAPAIAELLDAAPDGDAQIIDLATGGAGPWPALADDVAARRGGVRCPVRLTDLWPSRTLAARALGDDVTVHAPPVDARSVPAELRGVRTMFDGLHHLRPADARAVLEDAHRAGASIVIGEAMPRRRLVLLSVPLIPLLVLLLTPRVRPVRPTTLVLTYLLPLLPLVIMWDGLVSCLRTYRPAELRALAAGLEDYAWEAGTHRRGLASIAYLVGRPRRASAP
jgi:hypothetical protein